MAKIATRTMPGARSLKWTSLAYNPLPVAPTERRIRAWGSGRSSLLQLAPMRRRRPMAGQGLMLVWQACRPADDDLIFRLVAGDAVSLRTLAGRITIWVCGERQRALREVDPISKWYLAVVCDVPDAEKIGIVDGPGLMSGCVPLPVTAMPLCRRRGRTCPAAILLSPCRPATPWQSRRQALNNPEKEPA